MADYRKGSHTVYDIKYHFVWITKYRYPVLRGSIAMRARGQCRQRPYTYVAIMSDNNGTE